MKFFVVQVIYKAIRAKIRWVWKKKIFFDLSRKMTSSLKIVAILKLKTNCFPNDLR